MIKTSNLNIDITKSMTKMARDKIRGEIRASLDDHEYASIFNYINEKIHDTAVKGQDCVIIYHLGIPLDKLEYSELASKWEYRILPELKALGFNASSYSIGNINDARTIISWKD